MDHDDDGETSYNTFVDDVAFEPTYLQALLTAAGRNVATTGTQRGIDATTGAPTWLKMTTTGAQRASPMDASPSGRSVATTTLCPTIAPRRGVLPSRPRPAF